MPSPKKKRMRAAAEMAAVMAGRRTAAEKPFCISSSTKSMPVRGALKTADSPAPAPLARRKYSLRRRRPERRDTPWAAAAPIWTAGPAWPSDMPAPIASAPPPICTMRTRSQCMRMRPRRMPFTWGMPLPDAIGSQRQSRARTHARRASVRNQKRGGRKWWLRSAGVRISLYKEARSPSAAAMSQR